MIAFATAEDALNALCGNDVDPLDSGATYTDAARDRVLSELTALRAENARLREALDLADTMREMIRQDLDPHEGAKLYDTARAALDAKEVET